MSEISKIIDHHERIFNGNAWHGQSVLEILSGIDARMAAELPMIGVHTMWEIVLHITAWIRFSAEALDGTPMPGESRQNEDWPKVSSFSNDNWETAVNLLKNEHTNLLHKMYNLNDAALTKTVPGRDYDFYYLLHGIVQHNLYHAGQIALIKSSLIKRKSAL